MIWEAALAGVVVQGITGSSARAHVRAMLDAGTPLIAGVSPGRAGESVCGIPVYDTISEARKRHAFDATVLFVPGPHTLEAAAEALLAGVRTVVAVAEGVSAWDAIELRGLARLHGALVLGPNTAA